MNTNNKLEYHPLIKLYANSFASIISGILGWRLINLDEFISLLEERGDNDRVALASQVLQASNENVTFSFRKSVQPLVSGESDHHRLLSINAQQLIGHSWEILKINSHVPAYDEPVLEFFRHIRNGCFHGNSFFFKGNEPRNPAQWLVSTAMTSVTPSSNEKYCNNMRYTFGSSTVVEGADGFALPDDMEFSFDDIHVG